MDRDQWEVPFLPIAPTDVGSVYKDSVYKERVRAKSNLG